jgi:hypothetical protein
VLPGSKQIHEQGRKHQLWLRYRSEARHPTSTLDGKHLLLYCPLPGCTVFCHAQATLDEHINSKHVTKKAVPSASSSAVLPPERTVFVGGIPQDTTQERFKDLFTAHGKVDPTLTMICTHGMTNAKCGQGGHRGYGYVVFRTTVGVQRLLSVPRVRLGKSILDCKPFASVTSDGAAA